MIRRFVLKSAAIRDRAVEAVGECALTEPPLEIVIQPHKSKRTLSENAKFWKLVALIAEHTGDDIESIARSLRAKFLPRQIVNIDGMDYALLGSTSKLNVGQFAAFLDAIEAWAANEGIATEEPA